MASLWIRTLFVMAMGIILRCITFLSTSLPGPAPHCQPNSLEYKPPLTVNEIVYRIDPLKGCGDLIFSSHTMLALCFVLSLHYYLKHFVSPLKYYLIMYGIYWPSMIILGFFIIAARKHYTVDVVVAFYIAPLLYHASFSIISDGTPTSPTTSTSSSSSTQ